MTQLTISVSANAGPPATQKRGQHRTEERNDDLQDWQMPFDRGHAPRSLSKISSSSTVP